MAEASLFTYTFRELAEILVREQGIHEGFWGMYVKFGIKAANMGESDADLKPTAMVPILELGLQKSDVVNSLSVDAAVVNPRPKSASKHSASEAKKVVKATLSRKR